MRAEYEQYEQIERYLNGELSAPELTAFESRLQADSLFNEEVKHHRAVHDLVIDQGLLELKAKMKAYDAGYAASPSGWRIVSTVVLVVSLSSLGFVNSGRRTEPVSQPAVIITTPEADKTEPVVPQAGTARASSPEVTPPLIEPVPSPAADTTVAETDTAYTRPQQQIVLQNTALRLPAPPRLVVPPAPSKVSMPKQIPCALTTTALKVSASESCTSVPTGTITIDEASPMEGKQPLEFSIDGKNYRPGHIFSHLYPGTYYLSVKNAQGCVAQEAKEIIVGEQDCREHEYSFYPDKGEVWKWPVSASSSGKIEIYNRNGSLVYTSAIDHGHPSEWDGTGMPMGSYSFVLKIEGKVTTGYVSILR